MSVAVSPFTTPDRYNVFSGQPICNTTCDRSVAVSPFTPDIVCVVVNPFTIPFSSQPLSQHQRYNVWSSQPLYNTTCDMSVAVSPKRQQSTSLHSHGIWMYLWTPFQLSVHLPNTDVVSIAVSESLYKTTRYKELDSQPSTKPRDTMSVTANPFTKPQDTTSLTANPFTKPWDMRVAVNPVTKSKDNLCSSQPL